MNFKDPRGLQSEGSDYEYCAATGWFVLKGTCTSNPGLGPGDSCPPSEPGNPCHSQPPGAGPGTPVATPVTVKVGPITIHNIEQGGAKFSALSQTFDTIMSRLKNDADCRSFLEGGTRGTIFASPELFQDLRNRIGVAQRIEVSGNNAPGIGAVANVSPQWDVVVNGQGAFYYGGTIPGTNLSGNSPEGRVMLLLHEFAHVAQAGINHNDMDPDINKGNNEVIFEKCSKTILGQR